jgi:hypothetical protein
MRRVLREHGSPVPRRGCLGVLVLMFLLGSSVTFAVTGAIAMRGR